MPAELKARQSFGKYRIEKRLARGGFAVVYRAYDTIEGIKVALKIPHESMMGKEALETFRKEVRLTAQLDHPNILPLKYAGFIDERFVIVSPLGEQSLADRLSARVATKTALDWAEQMLEGLNAAHRRKIIHCDIKPDNILLFPENRIRITDFGIARVAQHTLQVSGSGTVGFIAPEQAMGKTSFASDVFSMGLVLWRLFSGRLPEWPYKHPLDGYERLRLRMSHGFVDLLMKAIEVEPAHRYENATAMLKAFKRLRPRAIRAPRKKKRQADTGKDWQQIRRKQFQRQYGKRFATRHDCPRCEGPISEAMQNCPWCGTDFKKFRGESNWPAHCKRCKRGMKLDWTYCPWCYGAAQGPQSDREFSDVRYTGRCANTSCSRRKLMPFMRYCPWCQRKVRQAWVIEGVRDRCPRCRWSIVSSFWNHCPWCNRKVKK